MASATMMSSSLVAAAAAGMRAAPGTLGGAARSPATTTTAHQYLTSGRRRAPFAVVRATQSNKPPNAGGDPTDEEEVTTTTTSPAGGRLRDALAFSGPGPERINGRLAMVGFVSALAVEASRGVGLLSQAGDGAGLAWFAYTALVLSAASLAPLLQGESVEGRSGGFWNADAELWNGRAAMLGLVALAATEYLTGSPLISA